MYRGDANLVDYNSCAELLQSDHKPIFAIFLANIKEIIQEKLEEVKDEVYSYTTASVNN